jgi:simple sugar transport system permease protein
MRGASPCVYQFYAQHPLSPLTILSGLNITVIWWLLLSLLAAYVLGRTRFGNWILATGGSASSAAALGVPVHRVKVILFVCTAMAAALLGVISALSFGSADPLRGNQKEFEAAIIAILGGTLLSGGYGSVIGTIFGALTLGVVRQGLFFIDVNADWYQMLLGVVLFAAVLLNQLARSRAVESHRVANITTDVDGRAAHSNSLPKSTMQCPRSILCSKQSMYPSISAE